MSADRGISVRVHEFMKEYPDKLFGNKEIAEYFDCTLPQATGALNRLLDQGKLTKLGMNVFRVNVVNTGEMTPEELEKTVECILELAMGDRSITIKQFPTITEFRDAIRKFLKEMQ